MIFEIVRMISDVYINALIGGYYKKTVLMFKQIKITSVRAKLIIAVSSLIAVLSVFIYFYFPQKLESKLLNSMTVKADQVSHIIAYCATPALYFEDRDAVEDIFGAVLPNKDLVYILIAHKDSSVFAEFGRDPEIDYHQKEINLKLIRRRFFTIVQDIEYDGQSLGFLRVSFSMIQLSKEVKQIRFRIAAISLGVFIFGVLAISIISRVMSAPLKRIVETVEKIASGNLSERANVNTNDEIGFLAREFDIMADRLINAYKNLDELNQDLEIRIDSRTAALHLSNAQLKSELKERKLAERELSAERIRLMATLSRINEGVITTDVDNNVRVMNRVAAEITGWNEIDAIGKSIVDVFKLPVSSDNGATVQDFRDLLKQHDDQEHSGQITIVDTESRKKALHINVIPIQTLYGKKTGMVFIFHLWINTPGGRDTNLDKFQA